MHGVAPIQCQGRDRPEALPRIPAPLFACPIFRRLEHFTVVGRVADNCSTCLVLNFVEHPKNTIQVFALGPVKSSPQVDVFPRARRPPEAPVGLPKVRPADRSFHAGRDGEGVVRTLESLPARTTAYAADAGNKRTVKSPTKLSS